MSLRTVQLGEVCDFVRGVTFPSGEGKPELTTDSIACLTTSGVQREIAWHSRRFIPRARVSNDRQILRRGDILLSTANSKELVGKSCIVDRVPFPCTFGTFVTVVRPKAQFHSPYLAYWLATSSFLAWCFKMSSNTTNISNLRVSELEELACPLPDLNDQKRVAALLERADRLRRSRRYALELSDAFLFSVFEQVFGDPLSSQQTENIECLEDILEVQPQNGLYVPAERYASEGEQDGVEMVHMSDLFGGTVVTGKLKRARLERSEVEKYGLCNLDILVARRSLNYEGAAKPCRIPTLREPLVFESSMIRIRPNRAKLLSVYLYYYLSHEAVRRNRVRRYVTVSTISGINQDGLKRIEVVVPKLSLQEKFANVVDQHERLLVVQRETLREAEHFFQSLLYRAFAGQTQ